MTSVGDAFKKVGIAGSDTQEKKNAPQANRQGQQRPNTYGGRRDDRSAQGRAQPTAVNNGLPDDYVDLAEQNIAALFSAGRVFITTSKLRNILSMSSDIYNREVRSSAKELLPESATGLQLMRIRLVYEAGRERSVKDFIDKTGLLPFLKEVGNSRERFIKFAHYLEALTAYHRYFGGRDN